MNTENITGVRWLDLNTVLYSGSAYQSQGSSAAGHWINIGTNLDLSKVMERVNNSILLHKLEHFGMGE